MDDQGCDSFVLTEDGRTCQPGTVNVSDVGSEGSVLSQGKLYTNDGREQRLRCLAVSLDASLF